MNAMSKGGVKIVHLKGDLKVDLQLAACHSHFDFHRQFCVV